ncbi:MULTISPECIES: hypothetical protein [unclassified Acinetobacter]|uniref:hypothetical protein n=1 Tax=unclassified Acinetobacter TaxID=196816 RepID=UPI001C09B74F|nr:MULTISPECIES: hypothetical protein [unclassified Acinetobacter]
METRLFEDALYNDPDIEKLLSAELAPQYALEPYRVCRRLNILRDYSDEKTKLYPRN